MINRPSPGNSHPPRDPRARPALFEELLRNQPSDGSWRAANGNEAPWVRVYSTSMAVLAPSVEYGYLPIYQR